MLYRKLRLTFEGKFSQYLQWYSLYTQIVFKVVSFFYQAFS